MDSRKAGIILIAASIALTFAAFFVSMVVYSISSSGRRCGSKGPMTIDVPLSSDHFRYFAAAIRTEEGEAVMIDKDTMPSVPT